MPFARKSKISEMDLVHGSTKGITKIFPGLHFVKRVLHVFLPFVTCSSRVHCKGPRIYVVLARLIGNVGYPMAIRRKTRAAPEDTIHNTEKIDTPGCNVFG